MCRICQEILFWYVQVINSRCPCWNLSRIWAKCSLFCWSLRIVNSHYINYSGDILRKKQDMSFKFVLPQLIHTVKWKFDYILFRKARKEWTVILLLNVKPCLDMLIYQKSLTRLGWLWFRGCRTKTVKLNRGRDAIRLNLALAIPEGYYG